MHFITVMSTHSHRRWEQQRLFKQPCSAATWDSNTHKAGLLRRQGLGSGARGPYLRHYNRQSDHRLSKAEAYAPAVL